MLFLAPFLTQLLIGIALQVVGFALTNQIHREKPKEVTDMDAPTASAGSPIYKIWGEMDVKGINCLWYGDKQTVSRKVNV